jgi:hypothetical protein
MGRVARYKKIKACDPYSKQNGGKIRLDEVGVWGLGSNGRKVKKRSRTVERIRKGTKKAVRATDEFDVAPGHKEDEFDMLDLVGSLKKEKVPVEEETFVSAAAVSPSPPTTATQQPPPPPGLSNQIEDEERKVSRLLNLDKQLLAPKRSAADARQEGESKNAFRRRAAAETRQLIKRQRQETHNPEKRQRKKDFLNNKKKKKQKGYDNFESSDQEQDQEEHEQDTLMTGERAVALRAQETQVHFGEQAVRPPTFRQLPRGCVAAEKKSKKAVPLDVQAKQLEMEALRKKAQAQYAVIKAKRRRDGDSFHL